MPACRNFQQREIKAMLSAFSGRRAVRNRAFFALGVTTGFRASELCSLTLADVMDGGKVRREITVSSNRMKGKNACRTVDLSAEARRYLTEAVRDLNKRGYFSPETRLFGFSRVRAYQILRAAADSSAIRGRIGTHSMRKTFAHNIHQGFIREQARGKHLDPILEASRALGHRMIQNTVAYLPSSAETTRRAILNLGRILR